jgi:hypothetical protein
LNLSFTRLTPNSIPAGINIPNYDDIRQNFGFKNVSLGNILSAKAPNESVPFIKERDLGTYQKYRDPAFEVQVGLHELLGHGCGKLLQETSPGEFNFDQFNPAHLTPQRPAYQDLVQTWTNLGLNIRYNGRFVRRMPRRMRRHGTILRVLHPTTLRFRRRHT